MQDHAAETGRSADARICEAPTSQLMDKGEEKEGLRTDVKGVVVARETVDERLLWRRLIPHDPVRFAARWSRLVARW